MLTTEERFWAKVEKTETCWLWQGKDNGDGYGEAMDIYEAQTRWYA